MRRGGQVKSLFPCGFLISVLPGLLQDFAAVLCDGTKLNGLTLTVASMTSQFPLEVIWALLLWPQLGPFAPFHVIAHVT